MTTSHTAQTKHLIITKYSGGGYSTQLTLASGTPAELVEELQEIISFFDKKGGKQ